MTTIYKSSQGDKLIAEMPLSYAKNALNKLNRAKYDRSRQPEIDALQAHVDALEAAATDKALTEAGEDRIGFEKFEARAKVLNEAAENAPAGLGHNNPPPDEPAPELEGREAIDIHVAGLIAETKHWADGVSIENQGQADSVGRLHRMLQQAGALVDNAAAEEKRPHNEAINEIAVWQNGYTAKGLKKTPDGSLTKAILATGNLSSAWLRKQDDERRAREQAAAEAARIAAQEAIAAREEAKTSTDLDAMDSAEDALAEAKALIREADGIAKERVRSGGGEGFRAMSLRSVWHAESTGEKLCWNAAFKHYLENPEFVVEFKALVQKWADRDALSEAARARGVPGFRFTEERKAA